MLFGAAFGKLKIDGKDMEYIRFGSGMRTLVMLPGLGDSLRSLKGTQVPMAFLYRIFAKDFTVYAFSRRQEMPAGYNTAQMARDVNEAFTMLDIEKADIFGVSMGGMIAQHFAAVFPEKVNKLVLTVTSARPNPILKESIGEWIACAKRGDHAAFLDSNLRRIYSETYYRNNKWMAKLLGKLTKPESYGQFFVQAEACLHHDAYELLPRIQALTLVVGGEKDIALGGDPSREIAEKIPNAKICMYEQWGHGLYEEAKDFNQRVLDFLKE